MTRKKTGACLPRIQWIDRQRAALKVDRSVPGGSLKAFGELHDFRGEIAGPAMRIKAFPRTVNRLKLPSLS